MIGPVTRQVSREAVVVKLVDGFANVVGNCGITLEPVEVVNATLQYLAKTLKFTIRHSNDHQTRMRNQQAFCDALDVVKMVMLDETDQEQVN
jgi:ribosomal protein L14E/L6E/L27E